LEVTVLRVVRPHATNKERDPRVSWFVWMGDQEVDLAQIALGYALRFGQEHGYRFDKQALLWEKPRLRTPEQFERWSKAGCHRPQSSGVGSRSGRSRTASVGK
jgi:hypothetical protein